MVQLKVLLDRNTILLAAKCVLCALKLLLHNWCVQHKIIKLKHKPQNITHIQLEQLIASWSENASAWMLHAWTDKQVKNILPPWPIWGVTGAKQCIKISNYLCLQCFDTVGWVSGRASACKDWAMRWLCGYLSGARCRLFAYGPADATAISLKSTRVLPFWYHLTQVAQ